MQNLPITATLPVTPTQATAAATDNNSTPVAEPFDSVLARQQANANESDADTGDGSEPASSSADGTAITAIRGKKLVELQAPAPDVASTLPGDMLAALLPVPTNANDTETNKKTGLHKPAPDVKKASLLATPASGGIGALPAGALAVLTPVSATLTPVSRVLAPVSKTLAPASTASVSASGVLQDASAATAMHARLADTHGGAQQSVESQMTPSLFRAQGGAMPVAITGDANTNIIQGNTFSAALEASDKDAAGATRFNNMGMAQISAQTQQPDAAAMASLTQISTASIAVSQNAPAQAVINTPVTHDAWGDDFNQKITWLATQHEQSAELHLNPPHLGPLDVVLKVSGDQATAMFPSPHAAVRDAVEQALPRLREMLADNGIMLGNATVNDHSPREQPREDGSLPGRASDVAATGSSIHVGGAIAPVRRHQGMVDTFA